VLPFDLDNDPGEGNLNIRAYLASVVGPKRVAHGTRSVVRVPTANSEELAKNPSKNHQVYYIEVWLPAQAGAVGARVLFSSSESMGESGVLITFNPPAAPGQLNDRYRAVLLPTDHLYAQVISDAGGQPVVGQVPMVVSKVVF